MLESLNLYLAIPASIVIILTGLITGFIWMESRYHPVRRVGRWIYAQTFGRFKKYQAFLETVRQAILELDEQVADLNARLMEYKKDTQQLRDWVTHLHTTGARPNYAMSVDELQQQIQALQARIADLEAAQSRSGVFDRSPEGRRIKQRAEQADTPN